MSSVLACFAWFVTRGRPIKMILCVMSTIGSFRRARSLRLTPTMFGHSFTGESLLTMPRKHSLIVKSSPIWMMPEGPEVRTFVDQLRGGIGKRLVDVQFLSGRYVRHGRPEGFESFAATMTPVSKGTAAAPSDNNNGEQSEEDETPVDTIVEWNAKGKFIYIVLDAGSRSRLQNYDGSDDDVEDDYQRSIWVTLGMSGQFVTESVHQQDPRYARWMLVLMDVQSGSSCNVYYHDRRSFGTLKFCLSADALRAKLASLGPDILDKGSTTEGSFLSILDSQKPSLNICKFLMDQQKISGVGNYILSEALYRAKIDPFASIDELDIHQRRALFQQTQAVALESYASQGMTRPDGGTYQTYEGDPGSFAFQLQCYGRAICAKGNPVIHETNGPHKRSIWFVEDQLFKPRFERESCETATRTTTDPADKSLAALPDAKCKSSPSMSGIDASDDDGNRSTIPESKPIPLTGNLLDGLTDPGWREALLEFTSSERFQRLERFVQDERESGATIYPPQEDIFAAMNLCPLHQTKLVILGQDPYHGPNQGHGLAFSVRHGVPPPPSLKNIFKEAMDDVGIDAPRHGNLEGWSRQGVLLLNTVLTVRRGEANSHAKKGWEQFTDEVVRVLSDIDGDSRKVFLLWGRPAAQKAQNVDTAKHVVIQTSHPSPLGATKTTTPFLTSKCFSRANQALVEMGKQPINWNVTP